MGKQFQTIWANFIMAKYHFKLYGNDKTYKKVPSRNKDNKVPSMEELQNYKA